MDSVIFPSTSTLTGPKFFEMWSRELYIGKYVHVYIYTRTNVPAVHVLHAKYNVSGFVLECSVECDDLSRIAVVADLELSEDLLPYFFLCIDSDDLSRGSQLV